MQYYYDAVTKTQNLLSLGQNKFVKWDEVLPTAKPGDLIEFCRGPYNHWAMYSEEYGKVYNICAESKNQTTALIRLQSLEYVCNLGPSEDCQRARVSNKDQFRGVLPTLLTASLKPLPTSESIKMAREMLGTEVEYSFTDKNCEYYCTLWRFGKGFTEQAFKY